MNLFKAFEFFKKNVLGVRSVSADTSLKIQREWKHISVLLKGGLPSQLRQALIAADKTFDKALMESMAGDSFSERMRNARYKYDPSFFNKIWEAHKLRNNLVHEVGFDPPHFLIRESVEVFRKAMYELGIRL